MKLKSVIFAIALAILNTNSVLAQFNPSCGMGFCASSGTGAPPPPPLATYVLDTFNNNTGSNTPLNGWTPDVGSIWAKNSASATDNASVTTSHNVIGTDSTGSYYVNPTSIPSANYNVIATLADQTGTFSAPSLFTGFSSSALTGSKVYHDSTTSTQNLVLQSGSAGSFTTLSTIPTGPSWSNNPHTLSYSRWVLSDRVRYKIWDQTSNQMWAFDDTGGSRNTTTGFPGLGLRQTATVANFSAMQVQSPAPGSTLTANGVWTWFNGPPIYDAGTSAYYLGTVSTLGSTVASKLVSGTPTSTTLSSLLEADDHNNPAPIVLPGGHGFFAYSKHGSDTVGIRYRISTNVLPDISAFNTEVDVPNLGGRQTSYAKVFELNNGKIYVFFRSGTAGTTMPQNMMVADASSVEACVSSCAGLWTVSSIVQVTLQRPYVVASQNGPDRIDFLTTNGHPNEVPTSLYHFYMKLVSGVEHWYQSDGTEILTGLPFDPSVSATLIADTTGGRNWDWMVRPGADGQPRALYTKYPSSTGARDIPFTDIQYWHARWTGSAWVKTQLASGQWSIYPNENHYAGGLCFDGNDTTLIYMSLLNSTYGVDQISKWQINESAQTVSKLSDITTDTTSNQWRPYSPDGHPNGFNIFYVTGGYQTYTAYQSLIQYN